MIFIDTNYFLRYLLNDVNSQHKKAKEIIKQGASNKVKLFTSTIVLFEIYWVMTSFYKKTKREVVDILDKVLSLKFIIIKERIIFEKALNLFEESNVELEDCFNIVYAKDSKLTDFATFDNKIKKLLQKD